MTGPSNLSELQQRVFDAADGKFSSKPWYKGVCLDNFPSDEEIQEDFEGAVTSVYFETAMWDNPDFF